MLVDGIDFSDDTPDGLLLGHPALPAGGDDRILNLVADLSQRDKHIQEKMAWHFSQCDEEYGRWSSTAERPGR